MIVRFEDRDWEFDLEDIDVSQARHIKRATQLSLKQLYDGVRDLDADAFVAMYWLMKAQNGVVVDMNKVNFPILKFGQAISAAQKAEKEEEEGRPTKAAAKTRA